MRFRHVTHSHNALVNIKVFEVEISHIITECLLIKRIVLFSCNLNAVFAKLYQISERFMRHTVMTRPIV